MEDDEEMMKSLEAELNSLMLDSTDTVNETKSSTDVKVTSGNRLNLSNDMNAEIVNMSFPDCPTSNISSSPNISSASTESEMKRLLLNS
jgi:hypothetical protein